MKDVIYSQAHKKDFDVPPSFREIEAHGDLVFLENPYALPRFRIVRDVIAVEGEQQAVKELERLVNDETVGDSLEWTRVAIIEGITAKEALLVRDSGKPAGAVDSVRLISEPDPQSMVLETNLYKPGFVVIADTFFPGWSAKVDGVSASLHPANLLFRAVRVPEGRHILV